MVSINRDVPNAEEEYTTRIHRAKAPSIPKVVLKEFMEEKPEFCYSASEAVGLLIEIERRMKDVFNEQGKILRISERHRGYGLEKREWGDISNSPGTERTTVAGYAEALEMEEKGYKPAETTFTLGYSDDGTILKTGYRDQDFESREWTDSILLRTTVPCIEASIKLQDSVSKKEAQRYFSELEEIEKEFQHNTEISDYLDRKHGF